MKTCFVTLLALVMGCQPRRLGATGFPTGTYTRCAQGAHNPSGNEFLNSAGFQDGARLTLAQSGTTVTTTYVDQNGLTQSLSFSAMTDTGAATITQLGQVIPGFKSLCVLGPGKETGYPASMSVTAGALTYDAGVVFLTLTGDLQSDAGACGARSQPRASFWVACEDRLGGGAVLTAGARPAPVAQLTAGRYSCSTQVETFYHVNERNQYVAGGATGTMTLMQDGAKVTARYSGDTSLAGTLHFTATTSTTASAEAGQSLMAPCMISKKTGRPSRTPEPVPIAAGSLTMIDSTLFLSFAGTMAESSSCPGAQVAGSLICSK
jgi:hypothetical protein